MPGDALHDDLDSIWKHVTEEVSQGLPATTFQLWLGPLRPVSIQGELLYVRAPRATRTWVERRYGAYLELALRRQHVGLERIAIVGEEAVQGVAPPDRGWSTTVASLTVNPGHTFERFVIGSGNRLAHAAALAVAELPGEAYNPLFLHGPPGLGKSHLLGAIVDYLRRRRPELTVHYTTAERFTTEFVAALRKDGPERFKHRYRELDALLIDDVQALEGKDRTQEEFVHTFNALHAAGKQVVLSSDRPPEALARLAERLRDRFQWGLCIELGPPDLRTRTVLIWRMALQAALELPEPSVLREIASLTAGNVRRLEGAMTRVTALSSMLGEPVTSNFVRRALDRPDPGAGTSETGAAAAHTPSVTSIQEAVCTVTGVSRHDLLSAKRISRISHARQVAIYLSRELTSLSLAQIAREFNRDHTTALHATRAVAGRLGPGSDTADVLHRARQLLQVPTPNDDDDALSHQPNNSPRFPSTTETRTQTP